VSAAPRPPLQRSMPLGADHGVVAGTAVQAVRPWAARQPVVPGVAGQHVVAVAVPQLVITGPADQLLGAVTAEQAVVAGAAADDIDACGPPEGRVVTGGRCSCGPGPTTGSTPARSPHITSRSTRPSPRCRAGGGSACQPPAVTPPPLLPSRSCSCWSLGAAARPTSRGDCEVSRYPVRVVPPEPAASSGFCARARFLRIAAATWRMMHRWRPLRTARLRWRVDQTWTKHARSRGQRRPALADLAQAR
jgi:hypothetical protein